MDTLDRAAVLGGITGLREGASHSTVKGTVQWNTTLELAGATTHIGLPANGPHREKICLCYINMQTTEVQTSLRIQTV